LASVDDKVDVEDSESIVYVTTPVVAAAGARVTS